MDQDEELPGTPHPMGWIQDLKQGGTHRSVGDFCLANGSSIGRMGTKKCTL